MGDLHAALTASNKAHDAFVATIKKHYPRQNHWDWFRAIDSAKMDLCDPNIKAFAEHPEIVSAWETYTELNRAYYLLRDGPKGFLGGRGL